MNNENKYRKRPVIIDAIQITTGMNHPGWLDEAVKSETLKYHATNAGELSVTIKTLEGLMVGNKGDWIIRGVNGELYPCKDDIFQKTYEKV